MKITPSTTSFIACLLAASSAHGFERSEGLFSRGLKGDDSCGMSLDASGLLCDPINDYINATFYDFGGSTCDTCNAKYTTRCGPQWEHSCEISVAEVSDITFGFKLDDKKVDVTIAGNVTLPGIPNGEGETTQETALVTASLGMTAAELDIKEWEFTTCAVEIDLPDIDGVPEEFYTLLESCTCNVTGTILAPTVSAGCGNYTVTIDPFEFEFE
jgi:hypothetical protein